MNRKQTKLTGEQKLAILKEHLVNDKPVSELCKEYNVAPSAFYRWQQELFTNGASCFGAGANSKSKRESHKIKSLEAKLEKSQKTITNKNEVLAELVSEHVALKKSLGEV